MPQSAREQGRFSALASAGATSSVIAKLDGTSAGCADVVAARRGSRLLAPDLRAQSSVDAPRPPAATVAGDEPELRWLRGEERLIAGLGDDRNPTWSS